MSLADALAPGSVHRRARRNRDSWRTSAPCVPARRFQAQLFYSLAQHRQQMERARATCSTNTGLRDYLFDRDRIYILNLDDSRN